MLTDSANIIFRVAKRRCYTLNKKATNAPAVPEIDEEPGWEVMDELEGFVRTKPTTSGQPAEKRKKWLPEGMDPVLEELPKWSLVADALQEIEEEMIRRSSQLTSRES